MIPRPPSRVVAPASVLSGPGCRALVPAIALGWGIVALAGAATGCDRPVSRDRRADAVRWAGRRRSRGRARRPVLPGVAAEARRGAEHLLASARPRIGPAPVAIVAPHAAYMYPGQIAADAYAQVAGSDVRLVVVLAPNHTRAGAGTISIHPGSAFETPLGRMAIDVEARRSLIEADSTIRLDAAPQAGEHAVEVQLPFVQKLFPAATLLPVVVGIDDPLALERLGSAVAGVVRGRHALIVASSDLSHYPNARTASDADRRTLRAVARMDARALRDEAQSLVRTAGGGLDTAACGLAPMMVATIAAKALGAGRAVVVSYANSADVAVGDPDRVVGYGAVAFLPGSGAPDVSSVEPRRSCGSGTGIGESERQALLSLARRSIEQAITTETVPLIRDLPAGLVDRRQGAFVTIKKGGVLRGCVGSVVGDGSLPLLVSRVAIQAALKDPRFPPVKAGELSGLEVEVSLLSEPRRVPSAQDIVPGRDGVVLRKDDRSALFLPQVATEAGWNREQLLDELCVKAELPARCWTQRASLWTFQADVFSDHHGR